MKVTILDRKPDKLMFVVEGVSPAFANALRRIMIAHIPTMAIKWADVHENSSVMFDEMLAHRLGLIPLIADPEKFNFSETCKCGGKGCSACQVTFVLDKTGPATVYSGDLLSSNKNVRPTDDRFVITELLEGQKLKLEAVARLGTAKEHARHQAVIVGYQYWPELKVNGIKDPARIVKKCPKGLLAVKDRKLVLKDPTKCDICRACEEKGISIVCSDRKFIFRLESVSGLDPQYVVMKATEMFMSKVEQFKKEAAKI